MNKISQNFDKLQQIIQMSGETLVKTLWDGSQTRIHLRAYTYKEHHMNKHDINPVLRNTNKDPSLGTFYNKTEDTYVQKHM